MHRIGFDPPPIKEENRLSGDIENIENFDKQEAYTYQISFASTRAAISRLEELIQGETSFSDSDSALFMDAGNELAQKAISEPLKYLDVLQGLRDLEKAVNRTTDNYIMVQKNLLSVLPEVADNPKQKAKYQDEINLLYLKELGLYEWWGGICESGVILARVVDWAIAMGRLYLEGMAPTNGAKVLD